MLLLLRPAYMRPGAFKAKPAAEPPVETDRGDNPDSSTAFCTSDFLKYLRTRCLSSGFFFFFGTTACPMFSVHGHCPRRILKPDPHVACPKELENRLI